MKNKKLVIMLSVIIITIVLVVGGYFLINGLRVKNLSQSLEEIMTSIYSNVPEDKIPMALGNTEITKENIKYYAGVEDIDFETGLASESKVGSIAHSVVLLRVKDGADYEKIKTDIKTNVNPRKWICVGVDDDSNVIVDNIGNTILLVMDNEIATDLDNNFKNLSK